MKSSNTMGGTTKSVKGISSAGLKYIACATMLVDHTGSIVLSQFNLTFTIFNRYIVWVTGIMHMIGRMSFVLFAFLIVEGFIYTSDRKRYMQRLILWAVVSEIPYNIGRAEGYLDISSQNVLWTLALGFGAIWAIDSLKRGKLLYKAGIVLGFSAFAVVIRSDYSCLGVLLIVVFYVFREAPIRRFIFACATLYFGQLLNWICLYIRSADDLLVQLPGWSKFAVTELYGAFAFVFIFFYNKSKGKQLPKMAYYLFYPVHMIVLWIIRCVALAR